VVLRSGTIPCMAGFDDVSFQVWEEPEPPRGPRRTRRVLLAATATALAVGAIATGASALTDNSAKPAKTLTPAQQEHHFLRFQHRMHHHGPCPNMGGNSPASSALAPQT
jgi:hypothetical protein